ncbi:MAG TPA: hypothetical protein QF517_00800 [Pseudomonadales bacterium]|jgi:hypothetical protein|nr:hypothetical protein [Gammaproteobacteria bacterium]MDP6025781.1 hypothetical protein [Pseudomonadales bacterium]MDP6314896.1 hypothetical protein [Pseudomonadales bacterium]MDP7316534.1 hypothetical protein [Pseudomonadales bacterium]MDP7576494.1 hypothetical protein [Pseudomonadales bacterium]|tara:strand:- start:183 stop:677 length:495 start_codon:yes stop_codon:yes gene_type:complete
MNVQETQRWIHRVNTTAALVLLTTGVLHIVPDIRSAFFGGYDRLTADIHLWTGAIFISFPILATLLSSGSVLKNLYTRVFRDPLWHWRRFNLTCTIVICSTQACAGTMIWVDTLFPLPLTLLDVIFFVHHIGAWYIGLMFPVHLWMARRAIVRIVRGWVLAGQQ